MAGDRAKMPRTIWALGFVSLFMDLSSETIHALLPLFLTVTLGTSVATVGMVDGIAEATASISKVFSGWLSDRTGRRKPLILLGYGLAALSKPLFPLASSAVLVLGARFADRIGKGLRGAPRDALVADVTPPGMRGRAFGLRQAMDTVGAVAGPLTAVALMLLFAGNMRAVFWVALAPAILSVLCAAAGVEDAPKPAGDPPPPVRFAELEALGRPFWTIVVIASALAQDIGDYVRLHLAAVKVLASQPGLLSLSPDDQHLVLQNSKSAYPDVVGFGTVGANGDSIARADKLDQLSKEAMLRIGSIKAVIAV